MIVAYQFQINGYNRTVFVIGLGLQLRVGYSMVVVCMQAD